MGHTASAVEHLAEHAQTEHTNRVAPGIRYRGGVWTPYTIRLRSSLLAKLVVLAALAVQLAAVIFLAVHGAYNMTMYTYWSYTLLTAFYVVLLVALFWRHRVLSAVLMFGLPLVLANAVFVAAAIIVIIANSAEALRRDTELDTPPGKITLEQLHTGDWMIHGAPVFGLTLVLLAGVYMFTRELLRRQMHAWSWLGHYLYALWWYGAPLALIGIYWASHDIDKKYPTSFTAAQRTFILLGISLGWNVFAWFCFTQKNDIEAVHADTLPDVSDALPVPHADAEPSELVIGAAAAAGHRTAWSVDTMRA